VLKGQFEEGIADLEWFLARHPNDPAGHFELAMAQAESDPVQALAHFDRALALKPDFVEAHAARGGFLYRQGKPEAALADLEFAAARNPAEALSLDRLGQTYLALDRPADAVRVLRKAAELAPDDSRVQLHFGRALADAGMAAESKTVMERFRQLGPEKKMGVPAGLVDYLSLTPEQQRADYRARVEKAVAANPGDASAQLRYLQLLLADGKVEQASATARRILALQPGASVLGAAGRTLLEAGQYALAAEVLERVKGPDYHLAQAFLLEASGKRDEALAACDRALASPSPGPDFYLQAAALLTRAGQFVRASSLLEAAPQRREVLLAKATTLELAGRTADAERLLNQVQNRWPEWHAGWAARGVVLASHRRCDEARQLLETAVALGAHSSEVRDFLASCGAAESEARKASLFQKRPQDW
jgi:tetratricopeptide (TPR) repeat protein